MPDDQDFDIEKALGLIRDAVRSYPKPAAFQLADEGFNSGFEQLVACIISIRTRDEVTVPIAHDFFHQARTPEAVCQMSIEEVDRLIRHSTYHGEKSYWIKEAACTIVNKYGGKVPCDYKTLLAFKGIGPKCANLILGIAYGQPAIVVDTHVHRLVNAWGYVHTSNPVQTLKALEAKLPKRYWIELNRLLIPFDKFACNKHHRDELNPETRSLCPLGR